MRYLRQNTATIVTVGPFYDKTDGVTIEGALTITNERISFTVDLNDGSAPTLVLDNVTGATSGTSNDLNYITGCDAGLMQLELSAANTNYVGRAFLSITDAANHCPVFHEFTILPGQVYDSLILGTDLLDANASQLGGTSQTGRDIGASVLLSSGTGTGQISLASGAVTVGTNNDKTGYTVSTVSDKTGYSLSASQTFNVTGNITGNLSGSVGSVTGAVGSVTGNVGGNVTGSVGSISGVTFPTNFGDMAITVTTGRVTVGTNADKAGYSISGTKTTLDVLNDLSAANVNAEVVDAIATDTYAEPGQGTPAATASLKDKIGYLYKFLRNRITVTNSQISVYNDDAATVDHKSAHSDDATTYDRGEFGSGP